MSPKTVRKILVTLTREESFVLFYKLNEESHSTIAGKMHLSVQRIQNFSTDVYRRFGLIGGEWNKLRDKTLTIMMRVAKPTDWKNWEWPTYELQKEIKDEESDKLELNEVDQKEVTPKKNKPDQSDLDQPQPSELTKQGLIEEEKERKDKLDEEKPQQPAFEEERKTEEPIIKEQNPDARPSGVESGQALSPESAIPPASAPIRTSTGIPKIQEPSTPPSNDQPDTPNPNSPSTPPQSVPPKKEPITWRDIFNFQENSSGSLVDRLNQYAKKPACQLITFAIIVVICIGCSGIIFIPIFIKPHSSATPTSVSQILSTNAPNTLTFIPTFTETVTPETPPTLKPIQIFPNKVTSTPPPPPTQTPTVTPLPPTYTPRPTEQILYQEDFSDGHLPTQGIESGKAQNSGGSLTALGQTPLILSIGDNSWKNYDIQISFTAFNADSCYFSLGVRAKDKNNMVALNYERAGRLQWETIKNGTGENWIGQESLFPFAPMVMEVIVNDDHFDWVGHADPAVSGYPQGGVVLGITCIEIESIKITALP